MRDLITLADGRERRARAELARLAAERARALEVGNGAHPGPRTPGASAGTESSAAAGAGDAAAVALWVVSALRLVSAPQAEATGGPPLPPISMQS